MRILGSTGFTKIPYRPAALGRGSSRARFELGIRLLNNFYFSALTRRAEKRKRDGKERK